MLKYFKRQKSQRSVENAKDVATEKRLSLLSTSSFCDEILAEEDDDKSLSSLSDAVNAEEIFSYSSKLSMSIRDILSDSECITLFVQYLEAKNALPLIKFYLDVENFRIAALGQLEKQQRQQQSQQQHQQNSTSNDTNAQSETEIENVNEPAENGCLRDEDMSEAANKVPELKTLCDLITMQSMHKPLTDDEKSQIYAETNKQITKCALHNGHLPKKACSQLSLTSELSFDVAQTCVTAASVKDAIAIYQKYLCPDALLFVELPVSLLSNISLLLCKRQDDDHDTSEEAALLISADCFDEAQLFVLQELERLYLTDFLQSPFYCKFCLELITDEQRAQQLTIYDVLYSEVSLFFFMEFLEQHNERECLDFWTAAINFRKSYVDSIEAAPSCEEIQADAMIIYKKFFSLQAEGRLWLSDKLRSRVEAAICAAPEDVPHCFDLALVVTAKYLQKKYFGAFLKSELFAQYVNELKTKIQESHCGVEQFEENVGADVLDAHTVNLQHKLSFKGSKQSSTKRRHRKTLSDCSNEASRRGELFKHISQQNTLLAMQDSSPMQFKHLPHAGMSIDARQLTNPNLLWHRRYSAGMGCSTDGGLKFGRVNSLGRYERDFESVESFNQQHVGGKHNWSLGVSGIKIKNAMRKLVNLPEHKAQEEIAWQIAEMIVNDVTSVTLRNSPLNKQIAHDNATASAGVSNMQT